MALLDQYTGSWTNAEASHLLRRAGFGGSPSDRQALASMTMANAVASLVDFQSTDPYLDGPSQSNGAEHGAPFIDLPTTPPDEQDSNFASLRDLYEINTHVYGPRLRGYWLYRMRYSTQPFQEQMALLLHDHAPCGGEKIGNTIPAVVKLGNDGNPPPGVNQPCTSGTLPYDPLRQHTMAVEILANENDLYRTQGTNSFEDLLLSIVTGPAMLIYLDNFLNVKGKPQENLGREMMELFSLGVGNYSELDVFEVTRCITGNSFPDFSCATDYDTTSGFIAANHETGDKTVFGQTVAEDMTGQETIDVVNLIVNKNQGLDFPYDHLPVVAVHMSWKILTWFVDQDIQLSPPDPIVLELADYMIDDDAGTFPDRRYPYDFKATLGKLFRSVHFYDVANRLNMYKTPCDYVVGALKSLEAAEFTSFDGMGKGALEEVCRNMGMNLFEPPDVSGWLHGKSWLSSTALIARYNFANQIGQVVLQSYPKSVAWLDALAVTYDDHEGMITLIGDLLFHDTLTTEEITTLTSFLNDLPVSDISGDTAAQKQRKIGSLVHVMMTMPAYQLK
jgi:hypothetical protein